MNNNCKILVTGGNGFVGRELSKQLKEKNYNLQVTVRKLGVAFLAPEEQILIDNISANTRWGGLLTDCSTIIHTAARVHVMKESAANPLEEFRKVNVAGTLKLAEEAVSQGVKRFIFISSIKVNGENTNGDSKFNPNDIPNPQDPYAVSKQEAEQGLLALSAKTGLEVVIIRPPLIYGPGVKGNFQRMLQFVQKGYPLPLGAITTNKRSFISIYNLIDLIIDCIDHPSAANQIFLASDGYDLSSVELLKKLGQSLNKSPKLIAIPQWLLKGAAVICKKENIWQRIGGSLQLDISKTRDLLDWQPSVKMDEALKKSFSTVV